MNCKHCQSEIEHLEFVQTMSADVLRHIKSCASCREFKSERDSLRSLIGGLERVTAPSNFDARLRARLAHAKTPKPSPFAWLNFGLLRPALTFGFALVLLGAGFFIVRPFLTNENKPLSGIDGISSVNLDVLDSEKLTAFPHGEEITDLPDTNGGTVAGNNKFNPNPRDNFAKNNSRERIVVDDKSVNPAIDENAPRITINARSSYLFVNDKKVPIRSVSFGSPTLIDGRGIKTNQVSYSDNVW
jgi:hypothetical protein